MSNGILNYTVGHSADALERLLLTKTRVIVKTLNTQLNQSKDKCWKTWTLEMKTVMSLNVVTDV